MLRCGNCVKMSKLSLYNRARINGMVCLMVISCCSARGPHHPKSDVNKNRAEQQKHINEHLAFETQHIEEDLKEHQIPTEKKFEELTAQEKNFLYFKVHDLDGNDKLDGLEIFYSVTHHSHNQHNHQKNKQEKVESNDGDEKPQSNGSDPEIEMTNIKLLKLDESGQLIDDGFNHVVDVLDSFLALADLNDDGFLNYAEYKAAIEIDDAAIDDELKAEL